MTTSQKVTFCSHGNSAFQPIASSCKIVPQSQVPNPESPGKSFQPITMSCKIVSGMQMCGRQCMWSWLDIKIVGTTKQNTVAFFLSSFSKQCFFNKRKPIAVDCKTVTRQKQSSFIWKWMEEINETEMVKFLSPRITRGKMFASKYGWNYSVGIVFGDYIHGNHSD